MQRQTDNLTQLVVFSLVNTERVHKAQQGYRDPSVYQTMFGLFRHLNGGEAENVG